MVENKKENVIIYSIIGTLFVVFVVLFLWSSFNLYQRETKRTLCYVNQYPYRLPEGVIKPKHYDITLEPHHSDNQTFTGAVTIKLQVLKSTTCILINAEELTLLASTTMNKVNHTIYSVNGKIDGIEFINDKTKNALSLKSLDLSLMETYKMIRINLYEPITPLEDDYLLTIKYMGPLRNDMRGFYLSKKPDGSIVLSTQFESEEARAAFPSFDEPAMKATFQLTMITPLKNDKTRVLSNTDEIERKTLSDGRVKVKFAVTPVMSTYLVAFIIGEYDYIEKSSNNIRHRIYTPVGKDYLGKDALDVSIKTLNYFAEFFGVNYPISKLDHIAIPDFESGAMENWGLITYRETYLYFDNQTASQLEKENGLEVVSHEVSHQFTGNIITCAYWTNLFLNEGWATFLETFGLEKTYPEWNRGLKKLTNSLIYAMDTDSVPSSSPIIRKYENTVSKSQIDALFDSITYDKGGAVIRMFYHYMGEATFQQWMKDYFATYKYSVADATQFLDKLPIAGLKEKFSTWLYQAGLPVINVKKESDGSLTLTQKRFFLFANETNIKEYSTNSWWIPLTYVTSVGGEVKTVEFSDKSPSLTLKEVPLKFNYHKQGFYRINYPTEMWQSLISQINQFSIEDRFDLLNDIYSLATSTVENVKPSLMFEMLLALETDSTMVMWDAIATILIRLQRLLAKESVAPAFGRMVRDLIQTNYDQYGWDLKENESEETKQLRSIVLSLACRFDYEPCVEEAMNRFDKVVSNSSIVISEVIPPELRSIVYRTVVAKGGEKGYNQILKKFKEETDAIERSKLQTALTFSRDISLLQNTLELTLTPLVKTQDAVFVIRDVARNAPYGTDIAWNFVRSNLKEIINKCGISSVGNRLVPGVGSLFTSTYQKEDLINFFTPYLNQISNKYYTNTLEAIDQNAKLLEKHLSEITQYLNAKYPLTI
ncbi:hypothetical protein ABK040_015354 [Willaertia magna]